MYQKGERCQSACYVTVRVWRCTLHLLQFVLPVILFSLCVFSCIRVNTYRHTGIHRQTQGWHTAVYALVWLCVLYHVLKVSCIKITNHYVRDRNEKNNGSNDNLLFNQTVTMLDLIWTGVDQNDKWIKSFAHTHSHTLKHNFQCIRREKPFTGFEMYFSQFEKMLLFNAVWAN